MTIFSIPAGGDDVYALKHKVGLYVEVSEHKLPSEEELKAKLLQEVDEVIKQWPTITKRINP